MVLEVLWSREASSLAESSGESCKWFNIACSIEDNFMAPAALPFPSPGTSGRYLPQIPVHNYTHVKKRQFWDCGKSEPDGKTVSGDFTGNGK